MNWPAQAVWIVSMCPEDDLPGRLGDARTIADRLETQVVVILIRDAFPVEEAFSDCFELGADHVHAIPFSQPDPASMLDLMIDLWRPCPPRLIVASADRIGRAWSARLAARTSWPLISPALMVQERRRQLTATQLDGAGQRAKAVPLPPDRPAIIALRPGVAQPQPRVSGRTGTISRQECPLPAGKNGMISSQQMPADPATADIRHLTKLISGGRGVGSRVGFDVLRKIAHKLGAGVAASRMAVDSGWIEPERQVGQTGKSVAPDLYIACGISGASHHWEGMSSSRHIIAINTDSQAPLMQQAHLAVCGDLHAILKDFDCLLERTA